MIRYFEQCQLSGHAGHSRAFDQFLLPEWVPRGRGHGAGDYPEHAVPCAFVRDRCIELLRAGVPVNEVAKWVQAYVVVVMIGKRDAARMDCGEGALKYVMPPGWQWDRDCIYARLHHFGIGFDPHADRPCAGSCAAGGH